MPLRSELRYEHLEFLAQRRDRRTTLARDRFTGRTAVLKTSPLPEALQELRCLSALPPGLAPRVLDAIWLGARRLVTVLERLPGKALDESPPAVSAAEVPALARGISQSLAHLHRLGWVHSDLKPGNILVAREDGGFTVRLLDFGFAVNRFSGSVDEPGGTPPYWAPELSRGWHLDGRADLYSLGMILRRLFPEIEKDARWVPILTRLCDELPARRHPHAVALRDELARVFDLPPGRDLLPEFAAGPMQGRRETVEGFAHRIGTQPGIRVLVQARPGTGLSRFLVETVQAVASAGGPPLRMIDCAEFGSAEDLARALSVLERRTETGTAVLCGVADPSPGLRWMDDDWRRRFEKLLDGTGWERFSLRPLEAESFADIAAGSMGSADPGVRSLGLQLHERTEGDLRRAAAGFRHCLEQCGIEDGAAWNLAPGGLTAALHGWCVPPAPPRLANVPVDLASWLRICARAGASLESTLADSLLGRFARDDARARLCRHGYLVAAGEDRLRFVTLELHREASADCENAAEIDAWLNANQEPDFENPEELIRACLRARRLGDRAREGESLARAFAGFEATRRWRESLRLFAYPDAPPTSWDVETLLARITRLTELMSPPWTYDRFLGIAVESVRSAAPALSNALLVMAAGSTEPETAAAALYALAETAGNRLDEEEFQRRRRAFEPWEGRCGRAPRGALAFLDARHALATGGAQRAGELAARAAEELRGCGLLMESLNLQLLAITQFPRDPERAVENMERAVDAVRDPEHDAQLRYNLALMYGRLGRMEKVVPLVGAGIEADQGRVSFVRILGLRVLRAWAWADLDNIEQALREGQALLELAQARLSSARLAPIRMLVGFCHLHRGLGRMALREFFRGCTESAGDPLPLQVQGHRYLLDALLDLDHRAQEREYCANVPMVSGGEDPEIRIMGSREEALRAQVEGRWEAAAGILETQLELLGRLSEFVSRVRYLHHLGLVYLSPGAARGSRPAAQRARSLFEEELGALPAVGQRYYRARALLQLARAQSAMDDREGAAISLEQAFRLAMSISSLGVLAEVTAAKARLTLGTA